MCGVRRSRNLLLSGCLLLGLAVAAIAGGTLSPIRDGAGNDIGSLELWQKKKAFGKKINVATGWVTYLNGYEGQVLITRVAGSSGFGAKGTAKQINFHGHKAQLPPRLEAGTKFLPYQGFYRGDGIPFSTRPSKIHGKYQFHAKGGSSFFLTVHFEKNGVEIGQMYWITKDEVEEWTPFERDITWFNDDVPDRCYIQIDILGKQSGNSYDVPVKGTFYLIDELTFVD